MKRLHKLMQLVHQVYDAEGFYSIAMASGISSNTYIPKEQ